MARVTERHGMLQEVDAVVLAIAVYVVACVPAYLWLQGPVGAAGTVDGSVTVAALALGSLLFVPVVKSVVERRFERIGRSHVSGPREVDE